MFEIDKTFHLQIGVQGENAATTIQFDMTAWAEEFPGATFHVLFKRYNEVIAYPVTTTYQDGILSWTPTVTETAIPGVGYTEVRAIDEDAQLIKKSRIIPTSVENSVSGLDSEDVPEPFENWLNQLLSAAVATEEATEAINEALAEMETATGDAEDATEAANAAAGAANTAAGAANTAAEAAEDAAALVDTAIDNAETATAAANTAAGAANTAAGAANTAAGAANTAAGAANTAAGAANTAAGAANTAADAANTAAGAANTAAKDADDAAALANGFAVDAQEAAEAATDAASDANDAATAANTAAAEASAAAETLEEGMADLIKTQGTEPEEFYNKVWVDTGAGQQVTLPEVKDLESTTTDTWSSEKLQRILGLDEALNGTQIELDAGSGNITDSQPDQYVYNEGSEIPTVIVGTTRVFTDLSGLWHAYDISCQVGDVFSIQLRKNSAVSTYIRYGTILAEKSLGDNEYLYLVKIESGTTLIVQHYGTDKPIVIRLDGPSLQAQIENLRSEFETMKTEMSHLTPEDTALLDAAIETANTAAANADEKAAQVQDAIGRADRAATTALGYGNMAYDAARSANQAENAAAIAAADANAAAQLAQGATVDASNAARDADNAAVLANGFAVDAREAAETASDAAATANQAAAVAEAQAEILEEALPELQQAVAQLQVDVGALQYVATKITKCSPEVAYVEIGSSGKIQIDLAVNKYPVTIRVTRYYPDGSIVFVDYTFQTEEELKQTLSEISYSNVVNSDRVTIRATDGTTSDTREVRFRTFSRFYFFNGGAPEGYDDLQEAFGNHNSYDGGHVDDDLVNTISLSYQAPAGTTLNYGWVLVPARYGAFRIECTESDFVYAGRIQNTNKAGYKEDYYVYYSAIELSYGRNTVTLYRREPTELTGIERAFAALGLCVDAEGYVCQKTGG